MTFPGVLVSADTLHSPTQPWTCRKMTSFRANTTKTHQNCPKSAQNGPKRPFGRGSAALGGGFGRQKDPGSPRVGPSHFSACSRCVQATLGEHLATLFEAISPQSTENHRSFGLRAAPETLPSMPWLARTGPRTGSFGGAAWFRARGFLAICLPKRSGSDQNALEFRVSRHFCGHFAESSRFFG
jgi:hypothetical protein